ncbi:hypothetical protein KG112_04255 [Nocardioides sp. zg-ZUI104]|uniref:DUF5667 domain-containing protein n=1 Tax=Nocardioides faecalis TaxID=2803858 RepID=UPI001BCEF5A1|nr:DUF5667 domain-containing protein [Nocardioides faecalis]MBS4752018.1 hypothetical protein [Nocardioides faecalis]
MVMRGNPGSRSAEEFDVLLAGGGTPDERQQELLELVAAMRAVPAPAARPEFVTSLRAQLVAAAEREPARAEEALAARLTPRQRRGSRERRLAALVGGFAVVSASGSMAMASQGSLPGDVLYPVKRAIENAQTNLRGDQGAKAESLIDHAEARLDEAKRLVAREAGPDAVSKALQDFTDQTNQAADFALEDYLTHRDPQRIADLRAFTTSSMDVLSALTPLVPEGSRPVLVTATQTVRQIDVAAWETCPACADEDIAELPEIATRQLSAVLSGDVPKVASVTVPGRKPATPEQQKQPRGGETTDAPTSQTSPTQQPSPAPSDPAQPGERPPSIGGAVGEKLNNVTKGVTGEKSGGSGSKGSSGSTGGTGGTGGSGTTDNEGGLVGTLVDGVGGLLGGLGLTPR